MGSACSHARILFLMTFSLLHAEAQITSPCSSSVISKFTPCLSSIISGGGSSPTEACCNSLKSLMDENVDCVCFIVTGNVPISIPFFGNNLAIALPRACHSSIPLQCKATGIPLPPPGPVLFGPPPFNAPAPAPVPAPADASHTHSPNAIRTTTTTDGSQCESSNISLAPPPQFSLAGGSNGGIRPIANPESAANFSSVSLYVLIVMVVGMMAFYLF